MLPTQTRAAEALETPVAAPLVPNPFLHFGGDRFYNPFSDATLEQHHPLYSGLRALTLGTREAHDLPAAERDTLLAEGWLAPAGEDLSRRFRLRFVSIETHTACNQACYFCPVSIAPREPHAMPAELFERIVSELAVWRATIEGVFLNGYNEPTADPRLLDQVRALQAGGLPPALLTNGTGLTPERVDALAARPLRYLSVNLSTLDRERYLRERGQDHLELVLRHLDHAARHRLAERMELIVLGRGDATHRADFESIRARFAGGTFDVRSFEVTDRAGYLPLGRSGSRRRLGGCENMGSRPLQHLHVTAHGRCVLCCQDYGETHVVGDLNTQGVAEVLAGPALARARRQAYGLEAAPPSFLCHNCEFARER